jgi:hypothetical protein
VDCLAVCVLDWLHEVVVDHPADFPVDVSVWDAVAEVLAAASALVRVADQAEAADCWLD